MTDKEALKAAKKIKEYCQSINRDIDEFMCMGCIFDRNGCVLNDPDHLPETWQLDKEIAMVTSGNSDYPYVVGRVDE